MRAVKRGGYVLLITLVLILMASLMLAGLARQSLMLVLEAVKAQEDLQSRWGRISCQWAVLNRARTIFAQRVAEAGGNGTAPADVSRQLSSAFELGGIRFQLLLSEEGAKVNLNTMYVGYGEQRTENALGQLITSRGSLDVRLRHPLADPSGPSGHPFRSWGGVFDCERLSAGADVAQALHEATIDLTLWGNGRLNVYRASDQAVEAVWRLAIGRGRPESLQKLRRQVPPRALREILTDLQLRQRERRDLEAMLTDDSECYAMWVFSSGRGSELTVATMADTRVYTYTFAW